MNLKTNDANMNPSLIGVSENIKKIKEIIQHVANTGLSVVVSGETGVGKEVVARNLYYASNRAGKPFVKINCAALPEGLLESELYGYEPGAFTGAERKRRGKFELSNKGVLFLDEIGDMPITLQSKLLHVLQSGEFSPLGSEKDIKTDSWIISATNHNLENDVKEKKFREDLYYRLHIIKIHISPLRDRSEDIPHLVNYYLEKYAFEFGRDDIKEPGKKVVDKLMTYYWPGNVRELQNVLKNIVVSGKWGGVVEDLLSDVQYPSSPHATGDSESIVHQLLNDHKGDLEDFKSLSLKKIKRRVANKVEREVISHILNKTYWNRSQAAKILKISYKTLLYKIDDLEIEPPSELK